MLPHEASSANPGLLDAFYLCAAVVLADGHVPAVADHRGLDPNLRIGEPHAREFRVVDLLPDLAIVQRVGLALSVTVEGTADFELK